MLQNIYLFFYFIFEGLLNISQILLKMNPSLKRMEQSYPLTPHNLCEYYLLQERDALVSINFIFFSLSFLFNMSTEKACLHK